MADLHVMYQPLGGGWVELGTQAGGGRGVLAESIRLEGDRGEGGCLSCSFKLKQDPRWIATQMEKATPIVVMDGAEHIWSGRIAETPMTFGEDDIEVGVNAQGWWQHLKDDCTDREWVIDDLSRFVDARQSPDATLGNALFYASAQVQTGSGIITLMNAQGIALSSNGRAGVYLDLGENNRAARIVVEYESSNFAANTSLTVGSGTTGCVYGPTHVGGGGGALIANNAGASGTAVVTPTTVANARFVIIGLWTTLGHTTGGDEWFKITSVKIFTDSADESGNASILKASTVISETLDALAPKISSDRSKITTTALNLPQFPGSAQWRYADELIKQANAPHGYLARLTPDPVPVFEYGPIPTDYRFVLGEGQYTFLEPAAQALQGVASRVITEYEDASGVRSYAEAENTEWINSTPQATNPSFQTDATGWSGGITRDTGTFNSSPASGLVPSNTSYQIPTLTTPLIVGRKYRIEVMALGSSAGTMEIGTAEAGGVIATASVNISTSWAAVTHDFTCTQPDEVPFVRWGGAVTTRIDDLVIKELSGNVVTRRGFQRTFLRPMTQRSTAATAQAISDLELSSSRFPPFKGTIGVTGRIPLKGGGSMDVSRLPACVGDNLLLANLHDPNSQGLGRIGNIQSCVYDHDKRQAIIGIDRDLSFITELKSRLALFAR